MAFKTITLKGDGVRDEALASGVITPGMLVKLTNAADDTVVAHNAAGENAEKLFAVEDDLQGKEIGDDYANGTLVQYNDWNAGDQVLGIVNDGANVAKGDFVESAGNGKLRTHSGDSAGAVEFPEAIVGVAMEAVDMSDSSAADPTGRIRIRII